MAVTSIYQVGRSKRSGKLDDKYARNFSVPYRVETSSNTDSQVAVLTALQALIPIYSAHPEDPYALLKNWSVQESDDPRKWDAVAEYSTSTADQTQQAADPTEEPPEVNYTSERIDAALEKDLDNFPLVNSAGDPFDPPPTVEDGHGVLTVSVKRAYYSRSLQMQYLWHFNNAPIWSADTAFVLCVQFDGKRGIKNGIPFWQWALQFKFRESYQGSWEFLSLLDVGYRYFSGGQLKNFTAQGVPYSKPWFLDGEGGPQAVGEVNEPLDFRIKTGADFAGLDLPVDL